MVSFTSLGRPSDNLIPLLFRILSRLICISSRFLVTLPIRFCSRIQSVMPSEFLTAVLHSLEGCLPLACWLLALSERHAVLFKSSTFFAVPFPHWPDGAILPAVTADVRNTLTPKLRLLLQRLLSTTSSNSHTQSSGGGNPSL